MYKRGQTDSGTAERPKVTHLMSVRDGVWYLNNSLSDIAKNSVAGDQIIIVDDGSTDGSSEILNNFKLPGVTLNILATPAVGIISALNQGLKIAQNEWVVRYDVDDRYEPNRVEKLLAARTPTSVAIFSDYDFYFDGINYAGNIPSPVFPIATEYSLIKSQQTANSSSMIRLDSLIKVGGYSQSDYPTEDFGLWMRLKSQGDLISVPAVLMHHTLTSSSFSASRRKDIEAKTWEIRAAIGFENLTPQVFNKLLESMRAYKGLSHAFTRKVLLYRNLIAVAQMQGIAIGLSNHFRFLSSVIRSLNAREVVLQFYYARKRRHFRSL